VYIFISLQGTTWCLGAGDCKLLSLPGNWNVGIGVIS